MLKNLDKAPFPWFKGGFLTGGMGNIGGGNHQQHRERMWANPACLNPDGGLFAGVARG